MASVAAAVAAEEEQNPWRTIEEHMSLARGPLFESARSRLQESTSRDSPPPQTATAAAAAAAAAARESDLQAELTAERARARSLARQRDRLRNLRDTPLASGSITSAASTAGTTLGPNPTAVDRAFPAGWSQGNEILLRRAQLQMRGGYSGREVGVRTAGLAMSPDGRMLWCACEEGIFEVEVGVKGRLFWPAVEPR
jgi:hypothetical protein